MASCPLVCCPCMLTGVHGSFIASCMLLITSYGFTFQPVFACQVVNEMRENSKRALLLALLTAGG